MNQNLIKNISIIAVIVFGLGIVGYSVYNTVISTPQDSADFEHSQQQFEEFTKAELDDVCAVPDGYTQVTWESHMSHHPDRYPGCL